MMKMLRILAAGVALLAAPALAQVQSGSSLPRQRLSAPTTFYVDPNGSDGNSCTNPGFRACLTLQAVANIIANNFDLNCQPVTISIAGPFSYPNANTSFATPWTGACGSATVPAVNITSTGGTVTLNSATGSTITVGSLEGPPVQLGISNVKFAGAGIALAVSDGSSAVISGPVEFASTGSTHINLTRRANLKIASNYTISASPGSSHINMVQNSTMVATGQITLTGTPAFGTTGTAGQGFIVMTQASTAAVTGLSIASGSATGNKFWVQYNSVLNIGSAVLPGAGCSPTSICLLAQGLTL